MVYDAIIRIPDYVVIETEQSDYANFTIRPIDQAREVIYEESGLMEFTIKIGQGVPKESYE